MAGTATETKIRDAERSRALILAGAEQLFARRGYDAASLADIGEEAGLSRGTPSYFFGSKEELYMTVLERMYADRNAALGPAFADLADWAEERNPSQPLRAVLMRAVGAYVDFVHGRPSYVDIIEREALAGGDRLRKLQNQSTVMEDAFGALRRRARTHGLRNFDVAEAIMVVVGLAYTPVAQRDTMLRRHSLSIEDPRFVAQRKRHIVDTLLHLLGASD